MFTMITNAKPNQKRSNMLLDLRIPRLLMFFGYMLVGFSFLINKEENLTLMLALTLLGLAIVGIGVWFS